MCIDLYIAEWDQSVHAYEQIAKQNIIQRMDAVNIEEVEKKRRKKYIIIARRWHKLVLF